MTYDFPRCPPRLTGGKAAAGCLTILLLATALFVISIFLGAWIVMLIQGSIVPTGAWHMSYTQAIPWGAAATLVSGAFWTPTGRAG